MKKRSKIDSRVPRYTQLIVPTFLALKALGGSGKNDEILDQIITDLSIPDEVADIQHKGRTNKSELSYQADWARTYLRIYGVIENSSRGVWSIKPDYVSIIDLDAKTIVKDALSGAITGTTSAVSSGVGKGIKNSDFGIFGVDDIRKLLYTFSRKHL